MQRQPMTPKDPSMDGHFIYHNDVCTISTFRYPGKWSDLNIEISTKPTGAIPRILLKFKTYLNISLFISKLVRQRYKSIISVEMHHGKGFTSKLYPYPNTQQILFGYEYLPMPNTHTILWSHISARRYPYLPKFLFGFNLSMNFG